MPINISQSYKNRLLELSGLPVMQIPVSDKITQNKPSKSTKIHVLNENIQLKSTGGRSEAGTLSWFTEEYLLNFSQDIINSLDFEISTNHENLVLQISKGATKIQSNTFFTKLNVKSSVDNSISEFSLSVSVNFEQNSNTVASVTIKGVTNHFSMNSKHSSTDLDNLKNQVIENFVNSIDLISAKQ